MCITIRAQATASGYPRAPRRKHWGVAYANRRISEVGMAGVGKVKVVRESYLAIVLRGMGRHSSVDRLCDQAREQNSAVTCIYLEFAVQKGQSATAMLGSLLKRIVSGMEPIPEDISRAFQEQKKAIGGWGPQPLDVVKMLQTITSSQTTFVCIGALDECAVVNRVKIFGSLKQILEKSSDARVFMTGRPHIHAEIEKYLCEKVKSVSLCPKKEGIIRYLRIRLGEDETPDAIDESLVADILEKIPQNVSEMYSHSAKVSVIQDMSLIAPLLSRQFLSVDARPASQCATTVKSPQSIVIEIKN